MKRLVLFLFAMLLMLGCQKTPEKCEAVIQMKAPITIREYNDRNVVLVKLGEQVSVELGSQPGTGYCWTVTRKCDCLEQVGQPMLEDGEGLLGGRCLQVTKFKVVRQGEEDLALTYCRPWDRQKEDREFRVKIKVK